MEEKRYDIRYGYVREFGELYWISDHKLNPVPVKELTLLINKELKIMFKHGSKELVEKRYNELIKKYNDANLIDEAKNIMLLSLPNDVNLEEINKCIDNSSYIEKIINSLSNV